MWMVAVNHQRTHRPSPLAWTGIGSHPALSLHLSNIYQVNSHNDNIIILSWLLLLLLLSLLSGSNFINYYIGFLTDRILPL